MLQRIVGRRDFAPTKKPLAKQLAVERRVLAPLNVVLSGPWGAAPLGTLEQFVLPLGLSIHCLHKVGCIPRDAKKLLCSIRASSWEEQADLSKCIEVVVQETEVCDLNATVS